MCDFSTVHTAYWSNTIAMHWCMVESLHVNHLKSSRHISSLIHSDRLLNTIVTRIHIRAGLEMVQRDLLGAFIYAILNR